MGEGDDNLGEGDASGYVADGVKEAVASTPAAEEGKQEALGEDYLRAGLEFAFGVASAEAFDGDEGIAVVEEGCGI
ncbi:hypothetical protein CRG98_035522 [Punica granatum]|uniref:Uncharacterized protein n=1 Tax=Punica granatum TaxID=22663 RepID=A0A2I0IJB1_PUNGR|nr:hypothetical protein CRG98_035522 [Punica granatum]